MLLNWLIPNSGYEVKKPISFSNSSSFCLRAELTAQETADVLNVSHPFLSSLLERGKIPFRKIGTHWCVRYQDVINTQEKINAERSKALDPLADKLRN